MADKERTEVYTTEYIDKELPRIVYEKKIIHNMTESESIYISISDKTSKAALGTFKELRKDGCYGAIKSAGVNPLTPKPGGKEPGTVSRRWR